MSASGSAVLIELVIITPFALSLLVSQAIRERLQYDQLDVRKDSLSIQGAICCILLSMTLLGVEQVYSRQLLNPIWLGALQALLLVVLACIYPLLFTWHTNSHPVDQPRINSELKSRFRHWSLRPLPLFQYRQPNQVANAFLVGITPWHRRLVITDTLVKELSADKFWAVIEHELGHLRHRHFAMAGVGRGGSVDALIACLDLGGATWHS